MACSWVVQTTRADVLAARLMPQVRQVGRQAPEPNWPEREARKGEQQLDHAEQAANPLVFQPVAHVSSFSHDLQLSFYVSALPMFHSPLQVVSVETTDTVEQAQHDRGHGTCCQPSSFATHSQLRRTTTLHERTFERRYGARG